MGTLTKNHFLSSSRPCTITSVPFARSARAILSSGSGLWYSLVLLVGDVITRIMGVGGMSVGVFVGVGVGVRDGVKVGVGVKVGDGVEVAVGVWVSVGVNVGVSVGVLVG